MNDMPDPNSLPKMMPKLHKGMNVKYTPKKMAKPNKHWKGKGK